MTDAFLMRAGRVQDATSAAPRQGLAGDGGPWAELHSPSGRSRILTVGGGAAPTSTFTSQSAAHSAPNRPSALVVTEAPNPPKAGGEWRLDTMATKPSTKHAANTAAPKTEATKAPAPKTEAPKALAEGTAGNAPFSKQGVVNAATKATFNVQGALMVEQYAATMADVFHHDMLDLFDIETHHDYAMPRFEASTAPITARGTKGVTFHHDIKRRHSDGKDYRETVVVLNLRRLDADGVIAHVAMATMCILLAGRGMKVIQLDPETGLIDGSASRYQHDAVAYAGQIGVMATATTGDSRNWGHFDLMSDDEWSAQQRRAPGGHGFRLEGKLNEGRMAAPVAALRKVLGSYADGFAALRETQAQADAAKAKAKAAKVVVGSAGRAEPEGVTTGVTITDPAGATIATINIVNGGLDVNMAETAIGEGYESKPIAKAKAPKAPATK